MEEKNLHASLENVMENHLQKVNYDYNIRGWMTAINDPDNLGDDLFAMNLYYQEGTNLALLIPSKNQNKFSQYWEFTFRE
jgi:myo-inositol-hexaphosphate 3-phosphohydrolase